MKVDHFAVATKLSGLRMEARPPVIQIFALAFLLLM